MSRSRLLSRVLAVVTTAATLLVLPVATGSADATPATCTTTYSAPGTKPIHPKPAPSDPGSFSVGWVDIEVPDQRVVVDVDWGFDASYGADSANLAWVLNSPQSQANEPSSMVDQMTGPLAGTFVMDDEAALRFAAVSPPSGRYRPDRPSSDLEGRVAAGLWRVLVVNASSDTGTWGNATLTLTVDCDADKDGVADDADNCLVAANPDQANIDDDALGNACDLDIDGDALANTVDGCPGAAAATRSGCPTVGRTVALRHAKATRKLEVKVVSGAPGCLDGATVTLFRARPGKDVKLLVATTSPRGRYSLKAPRQAGRYYVKVATSYAPGEAECGRARSKVRRVG